MPAWLTTDATNSAGWVTGPYSTSSTTTTAGNTYVSVWANATSATSTTTYGTIVHNEWGNQYAVYQQHMDEARRQASLYQQRMMMAQHQAMLNQVQPPIRRDADRSNARAKELLLSKLTPAQRKTFEEHKWFIVEGGRSKTRYRIHADRGLTGNIHVLPAKKPPPGVAEMALHRLCAHCADHMVPLYDHLLSQKLMLEHAEDEFVALANRHA